MSVTCPVCGGQSQDAEFCDHCNADLSPPSAAMPPERCPLSVDGIALGPEQRARLASAGGAVLVQHEGKPWRVRWVKSNPHDPGYLGLQQRHRLALRCLPPLVVIEEGEGAWVCAEAGGTRAEPWSATSFDSILGELARFLVFARKLADALEELHAHNLVWLNFDPLEIEEAKLEDGTAYLRFTNLDLQAFEADRCPEHVQIKAAYAAPEVCRFQAEHIGPRTDVFHLALYCYYWLAGLLPKGFKGGGLEAFAFDIPHVRIFANDLPPGIWPVLARGLAYEAQERFPSPGEFLEALQQAVQRAEQRWAFAGPVAWEVGVHSRTGLAKGSLQRQNEDSVLRRDFADPARALLAVADGISSCDVGNGAVASYSSCLVLDNCFDEQSHQKTFPHRVAEACRRGAQALLDWAIAKGFRQQLLDGRELMGSTLLACWLEGNRMSLANVGDSRAYLVEEACVEQLTVDGDLGSGMLAAGTPPEEILELGTMAKALRECIGGCTVTGDGKLAILEECCQPTMSYWPLLPGDSVILCSDGLVEEGAFLEPEILAEIVRRNRHLPAQEIAERLADAADALQRPASALEPDGFGDNISCIVIKLSAAEGG